MKYIKSLKRNIIYVGSVAMIFFTTPSVSFAQGAWCGFVDVGCSFKNFVGWSIMSILRPIVPIIVSLTVVYFLWGTALYIRFGDDPSKRAEGRQKMLVGIIGLAVITSFWAAARMLKVTFFG